jgi:hypothetical protein
MKALKIENVDDELQDQLEKLARKDGVPVADTALRLLRSAAGLPARKEPVGKVGHSLDHLIGVWTPDEAEEFRRSIESCEQIDESLWS